MQIPGNLIEATRKTLRQRFQAGTIKYKGVDIANHVTEAAIFIEAIARAPAKHGRPKGWELNAHLAQQLLMPVRALWNGLIDHPGALIENTRDARIETVKVQRDRVPIRLFFASKGLL